MAIIIKRPGGIKLLLQAANAPAYPAPTVPAMNADVYFHYVGDAKSPSYLGTFPVGKQVEIPFATDLDRDVVVTAVGRGPLGQQNVSDLRDAPTIVVESQREQRKPVIGLIRNATNLLADIGVGYYPRHMKARRIKVASDAGFTSIIATYYEDVDKTSAETPRLPEVFRLVRAVPGAGTATYYVKVAHSSFSTVLRTEASQQLKLEALRWGPDSDPLTVTFADANESGGSSGTFNPYVATMDGFGGAPSTFALTIPLPGDISGAVTGTSNGFTDRVALWKTSTQIDYNLPIRVDRPHGYLKANGFTGTVGAINVKTDHLASGSAYETTGTINAGTNLLTLPSSGHDFIIGQGIAVAGAGVAAATLYTTVQSISGAVITLNANASTSVVSALVRHDDTAAVQAAITATASSGAALFLSEGTFWVGPLSGVTNSFHIYGAGMRKTILKARAANQPVVEVTAGSFHSINIHDIGIEGAGSTSGASGHGIYVHDNSGLVFQITIRNVEVRLCGGRGLFLLENFSTLLDSVSISDCGDNSIEGEFDNSCTLINCYPHAVANGKAAYRIYSGAPVFIGCNGIDSGSNTWWGIFGKALADGDDADSYSHPQFLGCNVEDSKFGLWFKAGSYASQIDGTKFFAPAGVTDCIALKYDFVDGNTLAMLKSGVAFALKSGASWADSSPIHAAQTPLIMVGNRVGGGQYYNTVFAQLVDLPYLSVATNSSTNEASVYLSLLAVAGVDSDLVPTMATFRDLGSSAFPFKDLFIGEKVDLAAGATQIIGDNVLLQNGANPILQLTGSSGPSTVGRLQLLDASYLQIGTDTNHPVYFRTNNLNRWLIDANGTLRPASDNATDIGYNGGRVKDLHIAGIIYYNAAQTVFERTGTGSPEGVVTASPGARYWRTDGGAGTTLYVKESGTGNTGWVSHGAVGISGSGTTGKIPKFSSSTALADSIIADNGTTVTVSGQALVTAANPEVQVLDTGTGTIQARFKVFANDRCIVGTITNHDVTLFANNADQWRLKAAGTFQPEGDNVRALGASANRISKGWFGTSVVTPQVSFNTGETVKELSGTGSPEGVVTASVGSTYRRTDGGTSTTLYIKETGSGNTGWVASGTSGANAALSNLASVAINTNLLFGADNTSNIGASAGNRPANIYVGTSIVMANGATTVGGQNWTITGGASPQYAFSDGTVSGRFQLVAGSYLQFGTTTNHNTLFLHNGTGIFTLRAIGLIPETNNAYQLGGDTNRWTDGFFSVSVKTPKVDYGSSIIDLQGSGSPEGVITAAVGSTYRRSNGGANTTIYRKESGTGNTGWVAVENASLTGTANQVVVTANGGSSFTLAADNLINAASAIGLFNNCI